MINVVDISYYENMIDIMEEDRKINEMIITPKFMKYFTESQEDVFLCESKVTDSILNFFKTIFDKVINFFKKIINFVSDIKNFTPNKKLISQVENMIKSSSLEEKKNFSAEIELHVVNKNDQYLDYLLEKSENCISDLENIVYDVKDLMYKDIEPKDLDKELDKIDTDIEEPNTTTLVIKYNDLKEVVSQYENMYSRVKSIRSRLQADQISMNNYKKTIDSIIRNNNGEHNDILNKYKNITVKICNNIMKINKDIVKEMQYSFNVYEKVLKSLLNTNKEPESKSFESKSFNVDIFWKAIEDKEYLRLKVNLCSAISNDPTFARGEAMKVIKILEDKVPEIFEDYEVKEWEDRLPRSEWDKRYFSKLVYWLQKNFSKERIPYIRDVGRVVHKDTEADYNRNNKN